MSDRDRGQRGRDGFREDMGPVPSGSQYMSEQYNVGTNYMNRAAPPGAASMVADGVNPPRHWSPHGHGQWELAGPRSHWGSHPASFPQTTPPPYVQYGGGPPTLKLHMVGHDNDMWSMRQSTPLPAGRTLSSPQQQHAFSTATPHTQYGPPGPRFEGMRTMFPGPQVAFRPTANEWFQPSPHSPPMPQPYIPPYDAYGRMAQHMGKGYYIRPDFGPGELAQAHSRFSSIPPQGADDFTPKTPATTVGAGMKWGLFARLTEVMNRTQLSEWLRNASPEHLAQLEAEGHADPALFGMDQWPSGGDWKAPRHTSHWRQQQRRRRLGNPIPRSPIHLHRRPVARGNASRN